MPGARQPLFFCFWAWADSSRSGSFLRTLALGRAERNGGVNGVGRRLARPPSPARQCEAMADAVLRASDFSLNEDQEALRATFAALFERESPIDRVRGAEPLGFDEKLWQQMVDTGVPTMGVPVDRGGGGAGLVELALVVEAQGEWLAPVPVVPVVTAMRLLARASDGTEHHVGGEWLAAVGVGTRRVALALDPGGPGEAQLVPGGAVAGGVMGLVGDELVLVARDEPVDGPRNLGSEPLAWWDLADSAAARVALASGPDARARFDDACREWRLLTAAYLVGLAQGALELAVRYANERVAFGVPIGTFQAVAHPLADVACAVQGARRLVWKAAWLLDHEPAPAGFEEDGPAVAEMAWLHAWRTAELATRVGVHTQGGFGFTLESDMQLYFRRAKSAALLAGDPGTHLATLADLLFGPVGATAPGGAGVT